MRVLGDACAMRSGTAPVRTSLKPTEALDHLGYRTSEISTQLGPECLEIILHNALSVPALN